MTPNVLFLLVLGLQAGGLAILAWRSFTPSSGRRRAADASRTPLEIRVAQLELRVEQLPGMWEEAAGRAERAAERERVASSRRRKRDEAAAAAEFSGGDEGGGGEGGLQPVPAGVVDHRIVPQAARGAVPAVNPWMLTGKARDLVL